MPLVFLTPYKKTYSSEFCSLSTFIGFIFLILAIFIPLFAALSSEDFWLRLKEYFEQPKVEYSENYMLYVSTENAKTYFYSSNNNLNEKFKSIAGLSINKDIGALEEQAQVTSSSIDSDDDGISDKITVRYETSNNDIIVSKGGENEKK